MRRLTIWIVIATAMFLSGYDIFVIAKAGVGSSISDVLLKSALQHPMVAFSFGLLMGHLFWNQDE